MTYEWDPNKAKSNYKKHGFRFADAGGVFEDENALTIQDEHDREDRYITIGRDFATDATKNQDCRSGLSRDLTQEHQENHSGTSTYRALR